jgi:crossover junction endodeoxyribonuclease RuvC
MIILGVDPGTALTGYAIVEKKKTVKAPKLIEVDCIRTKAGVDMHIRLQQLYDELYDVAKTYKPDLMVVERLFFNTNAKTAMSVGQARGVPLLIAARHEMEVYEYTALQAKKVLTGYGRASKKEMQEAVRKYMLLDEIVKPDDANDAIAMALCYINKEIENGDKESKDKNKSSKD